MLRRSFVILLIILSISFGFYRFIYTPLYSKYQQNIIEFSHLQNELGNKIREALTLKEVEEEYKALSDKLESRRDNNLLNKDEINSFIIKLNNSEIVKNVDFTLPPKEKFLLSLEMQGGFEEIYYFLDSIKYLYNTESINISKSEEKIIVDLSLLFPIERGES